jgi:1-aminocyclopropane-1-carboxylate deaminase/D-cysteine desulfhydrase-like pyridoxal-dependent ACC family enzyme
MDEAGRAIFRHWPQLRDLVPWVSLGTFPTRIESLCVAAPGGGERTLWVKREDLAAPVYGGNKVRKLEFLLARARAKGATRLITVGAAGSHHALATTVHGRAQGFEVTLVLFPQPVSQHVRDVLRMDHALGAEIRWITRMEMVPVAMLQARLAYRRQHAFVIAAGGSDAWGTLGWVDAGLELAEQIERGEAPRPATIHVAAGTLGTAAGLALGLRAAGLDVPVKAARITSRLITNERTLATLVRGAAKILQTAGARIPIEDVLRQVEIGHTQIGRGYGRATPESTFALDAFAAAGLRLDATYTAKAAAQLLAASEAGPVLFVQTLSAAEPLVLTEDVAAELPSGVAAYLAQPGR